MADYIERDAVYHAISVDCGLNAYEKAYCIDIVRKIPAADVVQVVRCKDCRRAEKDHLFGGYWCHGYRVSPDGFCSYGERKEGV